jgi:hypothetical protein
VLAVNEAATIEFRCSAPHRDGISHPTDRESGECRFIALLDVALEHELDLASDIAFYGPSDYPMTARLLRSLAHKVTGFEFNSLRRWLSSGQFEQLMGDPTLFDPEGNDGPIEPVGFGEP